MARPAPLEHHYILQHIYMMWCCTQIAAPSPLYNNGRRHYMAGGFGLSGAADGSHQAVAWCLASICIRFRENERTERGSRQFAALEALLICRSWWRPPMHRPPLVSLCSFPRACWLSWWPFDDRSDVMFPLNPPPFLLVPQLFRLFEAAASHGRHITRTNWRYPPLAGGILIFSFSLIKKNYNYFFLKWCVLYSKYFIYIGW